MFESDDFDKVLSQLEYSDSLPEQTVKCNKDEVQQKKYFNRDLTKDAVSKSNKRETKHIENLTKVHHNTPLDTVQKDGSHAANHLEDYDNIEVENEFVNNIESNLGNIQSSKQTKKRILGSFFGCQSKRKFPGPAGLLTGPLDHSHDKNISHIEISSQDVDYCHERLHPSVFESKLWSTLLGDLRLRGVHRPDSIGCVKRQQLAGQLAGRKAHVIAAFIEAVDRLPDDPLIILRDSSGTIKCTLHRDAWSAFSPYIMSEYTALALWKPTILTTGTTFKKHYLTITLSNIIAIYCSKCSNNLQDDRNQLPSGYSKSIVDDFTAITMNSCSQLENDTSNNIIIEESNAGDSGNEDHLEGIDSVSFLDEMF